MLSQTCGIMNPFRHHPSASSTNLLTALRPRLQDLCQNTVIIYGVNICQWQIQLGEGGRRPNYLQFHTVYLFEKKKCRKYAAGISSIGFK